MVELEHHPCHNIRANGNAPHGQTREAKMPSLITSTTTGADEETAAQATVGAGDSDAAPAPAPAEGSAAPVDENEPDSKRLRTSEGGAGSDAAARPSLSRAPEGVAPPAASAALSVVVPSASASAAAASSAPSSPPRGWTSPRASPVPATTVKGRPSALDSAADWRSSLLVWRGLITYNPPKRRCDWLGCWAPWPDDMPGSEHAPSVGDYRSLAERHKFTLHRVLDKRADLGRAKGVPEVLYGRSLSWLGFYKLDQGDGRGPQRYVDFSHLFLVTPVYEGRLAGNRVGTSAGARAKSGARPSSSSEGEGGGDKAEGGGEEDDIKVLGTIAAVGSNEFGHFVGAGRVTERRTKNDAVDKGGRGADSTKGDGGGAGGAEGPVFTLARRYIGVKDKRRKWKTPKDATKDLDHELLRKGDFWSALPPKV